MIRRLITFCLLAVPALVAPGCNPRLTETPSTLEAAQAPSAATRQTDSSKTVQEPLPSADSTTAFKEIGTRLTPASQLIIRACDNYLSVNAGSPKSAEVLSIKAGTYYNSGLYEQCRTIYKTIIDSFSETSYAVDATRMIAQSFYEDKLFDKAQEWYRKLKDVAEDGNSKNEAVARIAESIFRMAESFQAQQRFGEAAAQFERVALEFPNVAIANVSLFNAGNAYEKQAEWARAVLMYQRLIQRGPDAQLAPKAMFRTAKCYEKLFQWEQAAQSYLRVIATYPRSEMAPSALYNAGICFENAEKIPEAAATFEKLASLYPGSEDAPDVLFKAGELYGKIQNWEGVTRVNTEFSKRFGNDKDRVVQALCMVGVALYMQNRQAEAVQQLKNAVGTYASLKNPSTVNRFYAAKAQFTMTEISHTAMTKLKLRLPKSEYQRVLRKKSDLLDQVVDGYSKVVSYNILEWTTRGIFSIAQAYEDFAAGVMEQQRPKDLPVDRQLALELGIAKAVDDYLVDRALPYHEQNVKLGIKEKTEDKYILESRRKLLSLPYRAAGNYLALVDIAQGSAGPGRESGFALIAKKLALLQRIGPFQERAIELLYTCLKNGATYAEQNEFYEKASGLITKIAFGVGETYGEVAYIARKAPIPETFDPYERFVYKTKLIQQVQGYEDQSLKNFLRTIDIAKAYSLADKYVERSKERIAQILFIRGRSLDLLGENALADPPFPEGIDETEQEEYTARFEEIGIQFKEQSLDIYRSIIDYANKGDATGEYVTHAYVRLFQSEPRKYGFAQESIKPKVLASGPSWKCSTDTAQGWTTIGFDDATWLPVQKGTDPTGYTFEGFPRSQPTAMWHESAADSGSQLYFRRVFNNSETPYQADIYVAAIGLYDVYINGTHLAADTTQQLSAIHRASHWDIMGVLRDGRNVVAISVRRTSLEGAGVYPLLSLMVKRTEYVPKPPGFEVPLAVDDVSKENYAFPSVPNFSPEIRNVSNDASQQ